MFWLKPLFLCRLCPTNCQVAATIMSWSGLVDISCEQDLIIAGLTKGSRKICLPAAAMMSPAQKNGCTGRAYRAYKATDIALEFLQNKYNVQSN